MTPAVVIENCAIATMDGRTDEESGTEHRSGHIVTADGQITAVGAGPAKDVPAGARRIDGTGCLATPGLINTHHHLYQWLTQGRAQQSVLFDWLTELYPVWARIDAGQVHAAATAGLAWLALSGCTTSTDHHYIFPRGGGVLGEAAQTATRWPRKSTRRPASACVSIHAAARWTSAGQPGGCRPTRSWRTPTRRSPRPRMPCADSTIPPPAPWCG